VVIISGVFSDCENIGLVGHESSVICGLVKTDLGDCGSLDFSFRIFAVVSHH
jgi:hypothetical protein